MSSRLDPDRSAAYGPFKKGVGIVLKFGETMLATEVVGLIFVFAGSRRIFGRNQHPANGVDAAFLHAIKWIFFRHHRYYVFKNKFAICSPVLVVPQRTHRVACALGHPSL